jgi:hypothetical protein
MAPAPAATASTRVETSYPSPNQSLIRLAFNKRGFAFSDELSDELEALAGAPDGGPEAVRRRLAEVGARHQRRPPLSCSRFRDLDEEAIAGADQLTVEEAAVLGLFPAVELRSVLQDYDGLLQDLAKPGADVRALLAAASTLLPGDHATPPAPPTAIDGGRLDAGYHRGSLAALGDPGGAPPRCHRRRRPTRHRQEPG